jgi:hypothetical protein
LLYNPQAELRRLIADLGVPAQRPLAEAVVATTLSEMRRRHPHRSYHFWKGQAGLWRQLLPEAEARTITAAHAATFEELGYTCDADPNLDGRTAEAHWVQLLWSGVAEDLPSLSAVPATLAQLRDRLAATQARLAEFEDLGPIALHVARRLRRLSLRYPKLAPLVKGAVHRIL